MAVLEDISFHVEVKAKQPKGKQRCIDQFHRTVKLNQEATRTFHTNKAHQDGDGSSSSSIKAVKVLCDKDRNDRVKGVMNRPKQVQGRVMFSTEEYNEDIKVLARAVAEMGAIAIFVAVDPDIVLDIPVFVVKKGLLNDMESARGIEVSLQCLNHPSSGSWDSDDSDVSLGIDDNVDVDGDVHVDIPPSTICRVNPEVMPKETTFEEDPPVLSHIPAPTTGEPNDEVEAPSTVDEGPPIFSSIPALTFGKPNFEEEAPSPSMLPDSVPLPFWNSLLDADLDLISLSTTSSGESSYANCHENENEPVVMAYIGINTEPESESEDTIFNDAMSLVKSDASSNSCDEDLSDEGILFNDHLEQGRFSDSENENMSVETFSFSGSDTDTDGEGENQLYNAMSKITRQFDAGLIVQSIKRGESTLAQIENRDCVLIVGKTGTGKSTLIQAMAGKKIQMRQMESISVPYLDAGKICDEFDDIEIISRKKFVYEAIDPLPGFEIGHGKKSKTTSISCYDYDPIEHAETDIGALGSLSSSRIMFVDSPGFEDTNGHEADIATSILLSQVANHCQKLRYVIMISFVSLLEDRGGAMRSVLRLIRSFTKDFDKEKQSFMFLFTHCNEIQGVPDTIEGAKKSLEDEIVSHKGLHWGR